MKRLISAAVCVILAAGLGSATAVADGSSVLSGAVRYSDSTPVAGVTVEVLTPSSTDVIASTTTATDGTYSLTLAPAVYDVVFVPPTDAGVDTTTVSNFDLSSSREYNLIYTLPPPTRYTVSGALTWDDGSPVTAGANGVPVVAINVYGNRVGGQAHVQPDGTYSLSVVATVLTNVGLVFGETDDSVPTAYGNGFALNDSMDLDATTGNVTLNLVLHRSKVVVHLVDAEGNPVPNATAGLSFIYNDNRGNPVVSSVPLASSAPTGTFSADYIMGSNPTATTDSTGTAVLYGFTGAQYQGICGAGVCVDSAPFTLSGDLDVTLQEPPPPPPPTFYTVSGALTWDDGSPVTAGANGLPTMSVQFGGSAAGSTQVAVNADGTYSVSLKAQVLNYIRLALGNEDTAAFTPYGNLVAFSQTLNLDATAGNVTLNLVLHRNKIVVHVVGADGNPVPNTSATVRFNPSDQGYVVPSLVSSPTAANFDPNQNFSYYPDAVTDSTGTAVLYGFTGAQYQGICGASDCVDQTPFTLTHDLDVTIQRVVKSIGVAPAAPAPALVQRAAARQLSAAASGSATTTIAKGAQQAMAATGTYSDGGTVAITNVATWTSTDSTVASVSSTGIVTGVGVGTATITASLDGVSGSIIVTVSPPTLLSIQVTPISPSLVVGATDQMKATGSFSDGSTADLTSAATWSSGAVGVATVNGTGLVAAVSAGATTITASYSGLTSQATVTVSAPVKTLRSIAITPAAPSIAKGLTKQFSATGTYSDGSKADVSNIVTWLSSKTGVAAISAHGLATGTGVGTASISVSLGTIKAKTTLTVTKAALVSITVAPLTASIAKGRNQQFSATGHYTDGSTAGLTTTATWKSSAAKVATIATSGLAKGAGVGTATISASVGLVASSATLTVTNAVLVKLTVTPAQITVSRGHRAQFNAVGTYSDGTTAQPTGLTWTSSSPSIASVSASGLATAKVVGSVTITAALGSVSATAKLAVVN